MLIYFVFWNVFAVFLCVAQIERR